MLTLLFLLAVARIHANTVSMEAKIRDDADLSQVSPAPFLFFKIFSFFDLRAFVIQRTAMPRQRDVTDGAPRSPCVLGLPR